MTEIVLNTSSLPEPLFQLIPTKKVKVRREHEHGDITPLRETDVDCPLLGMFADGKISIDKFLANKQLEKGLE
jgi:hypothetical protein